MNSSQFCLSCIFIIFLFCISSRTVNADVVSDYDNCKNNTILRCQNLGECQYKDGHYQCVCKTWWMGEKCDVRTTTQYPGFLPVFITFVSITALLHLILVILCIHQLWMWCRSKKWSLAASVLTGGLIGALMRVIVLSIDPYHASMVMPYLFNTILFNLPIFVWCVSAFLVFIYWVSVVRRSKILSNGEDSITKRVRWVSIISIILITIAIIPAGLYSYLETPFLAYMYSLIVIATIICFMTLSLIFGRRIIKALKTSTKVSEGANVLMKRISKFMFYVNIQFVLTIIIMIIFTFLPKPINPWAWLICQTSLRILEFGMAFCFIRLLERKSNPDKLSSTTTDGDRGSRKSKIITIDMTVPASASYTSDSETEVTTTLPISA